MHHSCSEHCKHQSAAVLAKQKQLAIALLLVATFAIAEFGVGLYSNSLALLAEAGHMVSDSFALILALVATWLTQMRRPESLSDSLPWVKAPRWELWAAFVNGLGLLLLSGWITWEALQHLQRMPDEIASLPMLLTAMAGFVVNGVNIAVLHQGSDHDLNLRAAFLHVMADAISSIGVIFAAIAVALWGWLWADGVISLLVAVLVASNAVPLVWQTSQQLIQPIGAK